MNRTSTFYEELSARIERGGSEKYHEKNKEKGKLFVRDRLKLLLDDGIVSEDGKFANNQKEDLAADGVVTGT